MQNGHRLFLCACMWVSFAAVAITVTECKPHNPKYWVRNSIGPKWNMRGHGEKALLLIGCTVFNGTFVLLGRPNFCWSISTCGPAVGRSCFVFWPIRQCFQCNWLEVIAAENPPLLTDLQYILNDHFENPPVSLYLIPALPAADKKTMGLYLLLWLVLFDCDWRSTAVLSHWWLCNHLPPICNETVIPYGLLSSLFDRRQESAVQLLCQVFRNICLN